MTADPSGGPPGGSPNRPSDGIEDRVLARVRALLAKAESTTFPDEAEALSAKAHELMARYAIDRARLDGVSPPGGPSLRRIVLDRPYPAAKFTLLARVAEANRCRAVWSKSEGVATLVGYPVDAEVTEVLYTSLLVQATGEMLRHGSRTDGHGRSRTRGFRHSFLLAFAWRVSQRLAEQTATAERVAAAEPGTDLVPVLAGRAAEVEGALRRAFPHLGTHRSSVSSAEGLDAGRAAADRADLGRGRLAG